MYVTDLRLLLWCIKVWGKLHLNITLLLSNYESSFPILGTKHSLIFKALEKPELLSASLLKIVSISLFIMLRNGPKNSEQQLSKIWTNMDLIASCFEYISKMCQSITVKSEGVRHFNFCKADILTFVKHTF